MEEGNGLRKEIDTFPKIVGSLPCQLCAAHAADASVLEKLSRFSQQARAKEALGIGDPYMIKEAGLLASSLE